MLKQVRPKLSTVIKSCIVICIPPFPYMSDYSALTAPGEHKALP